MSSKGSVAGWGRSRDARGRWVARGGRRTAPPDGGRALGPDGAADPRHADSDRPEEPGTRGPARDRRRRPREVVRRRGGRPPDRIVDDYIPTGEDSEIGRAHV